MPGLLEKDAIAKRESLSDLIAIADVRQTPFSSMCNKAKNRVSSTFFEWSLDSYANPSLDTTVDGSDVSTFENAHENKARIGNYIHYFRRSGKVSKLTQSVATIAGDSNPAGYARQKKVEEIKRDMECVFLSSQELQADDGSVGYKTRALGTWIQATAQSSQIVPAAHRPASAQVITTATASLSEETDIQGMLTAIFDATGMSGDFKLFAGSVLRRRFTSMTRMDDGGSTDGQNRVRTFTGRQSDKAVSSTTTIYHGDYGDIEVVSSSFIGWTAGSTNAADTDRGYVLDMDKIHIVQHLAPDLQPLDDEGGGPRFYIDAWAGLQVDTPRGMGKFLP